jgi:hypothetical protein
MTVLGVHRSVRARLETTSLVNLALRTNEAMANVPVRSAVSNVLDKVPG